MSTNSILSKIRQEIERYEAGAQSAYNPHDEYADFFYGKVIACEDLLSILDTLSEEPTKSLDEAAEGYTQKMLESWRFDSTGCRPPRESFKAGANWQKSQMLKDVYVESRIVEDGRIELEGEPLPCLNPIILLPYPQFKPGDKVRIIIIKED